AGRSLQEWSDVDLDEFCRKYNLKWVVCWTPAAEARFREWGQVEAGATLTEEGHTGRLFELRGEPAVGLKGPGRWGAGTCRYIVLRDVEPDADGKVVLSLHYQAGMQVSPSRVQLEKEPDPRDPIPFVRLRMTEPVTRVTLSWEEP